ncbi:serine/threonine-protein phosphatase 6 regulatory ankyrin repeat subunit B-like [Chelonus insularis]|uniref:serine/threonine-protein phosphatase 6 regulatory ankyrin repeat subunit B-like n=1 Tax=Chelonus insularis TaxID=460826 RepID=UPI00158F3D78|nr:serine/threonine-protein phosphatase 6 regulatory ankyrin repeat subunit B-like [Chelonus insularis]
MSFNYKFYKTVQTQCSSSVPASITVAELYLSKSENNSLGILVTAVEVGCKVENEIPIQLEQPDNFGLVRLRYRGLKFYDYFCADSTVQVKKMLLKKSTNGHEDVFDSNWDIFNINIENENNCYYLLDKAIENQYTDILAILLETDMKNSSRQLVIHPFNDFGTLLHHAVKRNDRYMIEALLDHKLDIEARNKEGLTPLHVAVDLDMPNIVDLLINHGADVNALTDKLQVPFHFAARRNNSQVLMSLGKKSAKINETDLSGQSPLFYAVIAGNVEAVDFFFKIKADYKIKDSHHCTPFQLAVQQKNLDLIEVFLEYDADVDISNAIFYLSEKSFHHEPKVVYKETYMKIIDVLLEKGVEINRRGLHERTPLQHAVINDDVECVKALLTRRANINILTNSRSTLLHLACQHSGNECIQILLDRNIDINAVNKKNNTALQLAVINKNYRAIELILSNSKIDRSNIPSKEILERAIESQNLSIIEFLNNINDRDLRRELKTYLHLAVNSAATPIIKFILENGGDINLKDVSGNAALHLAAYSGNLGITKLLIENRANVNLQDESGKTALHIAINSVHYDLAQLLLENGADVNLGDASAKTALHLAIKSNCLDIIKLLIANRADVNRKDASGKTVLHLAAELGCLPVFELILHYTVDVNLQDESGNTALHLAIISASIPIIEFLLENQADVNRKDESGKIALHLAVKPECLPVFELILYYTVNVNLQDESRRTALHLAIQSECLPIIELLLCNGMDVNLKDELEKTALHLASEKPNMTVKIIKSILNLTNDIDAKDVLGKTAVHYAVLNNNVDTLKCLLEAYAVINIEDFEGKTPLHSTIAWENDYVPSFESMKILLDHKANINSIDNDFTSLLHLACFVKNTEIIQYLIRKGADSNMRDKHDRTVFHYACMTNLNRVSLRYDNLKEYVKNTLNILFEEDISVNCADEDGKTPLHYAIENNFLFMCEPLLNVGADINILNKNGNSPIDGLLVQDDNSSQDCLKKDIIMLFTQHIIKMKVLELSVHPSLLDKIYKVYNKKQLEYFKSFENDCREEIELMKKTKFPQNHATYYNFLSENPCTVVNFTLNNSIVKAIQSDELQTMFPIYCYFLKCHLREAQRQILCGQN